MEGERVRVRPVRLIGGLHLLLYVVQQAPPVIVGRDGLLGCRGQIVEARHPADGHVFRAGGRKLPQQLLPVPQTVDIGCEGGAAVLYQVDLRPVGQRKDIPCHLADDGDPLRRTSGQRSAILGGEGLAALLTEDGDHHALRRLAQKVLR